MHSRVISHEESDMSKSSNRIRSAALEKTNDAALCELFKVYSSEMESRKAKLKELK